MIETTLTGKTPDIVEENIKKLMTIFPEVVTEGKVDFEKLKQLLGEYVDDSNERYNFTWNGKGRALRLSQTPSLGTLRPCKEESKDWDTTQNLYIEGDNLEVLKLLQKSYYGKIKMIYIDPPYNTGKDFVYKDDFYDSIENYKRITGQVDGNGKPISTNTETSGRYHTDWLNMMYPRLRLARNLLRDDGVIFISIDDHEVHNLRHLCDEIFGEENFVEIFNWQKTATPPNLSNKTKKSIEYILCYQKKDCGILNGITKNSKSTNGLLNQTNSVGILNFPANIVLTSLNDGIYKAGLYGSDSYEIELLEDTEVKNGVFIKEVKLKSKFKWSQEYLNEQIKKGVKIYIKTISFSPSYDKDEYAPEKPWNLINKSFGVGTNENASDELDELFVKNFSNGLYPKPTSLIKYLINMVVNHDSIILDFFAGSGTTGDAVMQLNAEDGGNRQFIMVQLDEKTDEKSEAYKAGYKNICEIGKERIRRAGEKIKEKYKDKENIENLDIGFKVYKLVEQSDIKGGDNIISNKKPVDIEFKHYSFRKYGEPKLKKPKELKGIKQSFSVDYIPKKCKCSVFIKDDDVWVKHTDYFSPSIQLSPEDIGKPLSYLSNKYCDKNKKKKFIYEDSWGDMVLRQECWIYIKNLYKNIKNGCFELDILDEILRQQEKACGFEKYELEVGQMSRFWENVIRQIKNILKQ